jgi:hypothetical protein
MYESRLSEGSWEREYIAQIFSYLPTVDACAFHRMHWEDGEPHVPEVGPNCVLVMASDEWGRPTPKVPCRLFCRQYARTWDEPEVFQLPLGVAAGFPSIPVAPFSARSIDVSFIGSVHSSRGVLIDQLNAHPGLKEYRLRIDSDKRPMDEYAGILNDSKIVICLGGAISPETFRFYEATKMGCITISPKCIPGWVYDDSLMIQLETMSADAIVQGVRSVLDDIDRAEFLHRAALRTWDLKYAPRAVAERIRRKLA